MDLRQAILERRSIRIFETGAIPPESIEAMKESLLWAPSSGHLQARKFHFVTNEGVRAALGAASYQHEIFTGAPLVIVGSTDERIVETYGERGRTLYAVQDVAASVQNLLLTIHAEGLGAVWIGAFDPARVATALSLPPTLHPVVLIPVGHPGERPTAETRLPETQAFMFVE